jgi:hypothetical protein
LTRAVDLPPACISRKMIAVSPRRPKPISASGRAGRRRRHDLEGNDAHAPPAAHNVAIDALAEHEA